MSRSIFTDGFRAGAIEKYFFLALQTLISCLLAVIPISKDGYRAGTHKKKISALQTLFSCLLMINPVMAAKRKKYWADQFLPMYPERKPSKNYFFGSANLDFVVASSDSWNVTKKEEDERIIEPINFY